jgi:copper chaperone CopZ
MTETTQARTLLTVPDISCDHCARTVTGALTQLDGIEEVVVDIPRKTVQVVYDPARIDIDRMSSALADEDYPVTAAE